MFQKAIFGTLLLCSAASQAFDGAPSFTAREGGVEHTLKLSQWKLDPKGIPSFDYVYEQQEGGCHFKLAGHAVAGFEERGGKVQLDVFNPEDGKGRALDQILMFYDDAVTMTLPLKGALRQVSFDNELSAQQRHASCGKKKDGKVSVLFRQ